MAASHRQVHRTGQARGSPARAAPLGLVPWERVVVASRHQVHRTGQARGSPARAPPPWPRAMGARGAG